MLLIGSRAGVTPIRTVPPCRCSRPSTHAMERSTKRYEGERRLFFCWGEHDGPPVAVRHAAGSAIVTPLFENTMAAAIPLTPNRRGPGWSQL